MISFDMQKFKASWNYNEKLILQASEKTVNETISELFKDIVKRTPVGDPSIWKHPYIPRGYVPGKLKASWNLSHGNAARDKETGRFTTDSGFSYGGLRIDVKGPDIIYTTISNNQPYAQRIEDGWSTQAPIGMVKLAVQNYRNNLEIYARRNKK